MKAGTQSRGFSLFELMIVVAVLLIIMAMALPSFMTSYRTYRVGGALRDVANILGRTRFEAVRNRCGRAIGTVYRFDGVNNVQLFGIDVNGDGQLGQFDSQCDGTLDSDEPRIVLPRDITLIQPGNEGPFVAQAASMGAGFQNQRVPPNLVMTFNQRGTMVPLPGGAAIAAFFLQDTVGNRAAVTVTPMGSVGTWRATSNQPAWHH